MKAWENKALKNYQLLFDEDKIEERLSKYLPTVKDIITFMGREKNIVVSPLDGRIILLLRFPQHKTHRTHFLPDPDNTEDFRQFMKNAKQT